MKKCCIVLLYMSSFLSFPSLGGTPQSITFTGIANVSCKDSILLVAESSSGLKVEFKVLNHRGTVSGNYFKPLGAGQVTIQAFQMGNSMYDSAISIKNTFSIIALKQNLAINTNLKTASPLCKGRSATLFVPSIAGVQFLWRLNDGKNHLGTNYFIPTLTSNINTSGEITALEGFCNILTINFMLDVNDKTSTFFETLQDTIIVGDTLVLKALPKGGFFSGNYIKDSLFRAGNVAANDTIHYTYTNSKGCVSKTEKMISTKIKNKVYSSNMVIYEYITPNGDGKNDCFFIENISQYSENELVVFNQWNNELYRHKNYDNTWMPVALSKGLYFYHFSDISKGKDYKGHFYVSQ